MRFCTIALACSWFLMKWGWAWQITLTVIKKIIIRYSKDKRQMCRKQWKFWTDALSLPQQHALFAEPKGQTLDEIKKKKGMQKIQITNETVWWKLHTGTGNESQNWVLVCACYICNEKYSKCCRYVALIPATKDLKSNFKQTAALRIS